jgi:hypothetical protein
MSILRLVIVYLLAGAGILYVQLTNTPCQRPLVLDNGQGAIAAPIDLTRLGTDPAYQWNVGLDVVFWLPRMLHFVVLGDVSMKNFLHARDCVEVRPGAAAAG